MNEILGFLNKSYAIKKAAFLVNDKFSFNELSDILINTNLEELQIVGYFNKSYNGLIN